MPSLFRNAAPANGSARLNAANDLVRRTLAQHGLMPDAEGVESASRARGVMPANPLANLSARLRAGGIARTHEPPVDGARFHTDSFTCGAGTRTFRTYVPSTAGEGITGLVLMLHGCTQTPEDFAAGTGMNALAETHRLIIVYPRQSRGDNAQSCWNWFSRSDQRRDAGEPAILAGMTRRVAADHAVSAGRVFVAGLSAGGAMAAILGETYPDLFAAVGVHSGLPYASAKDVPSAFTAMAGNAPVGHTQNRTPTFVIHGTADTTVHPSNGAAIARTPKGTGELETRETVNGREVIIRTSQGADGPTLEYWSVGGLGHAWSGGSTRGSYTDPLGPDASKEMIRFFHEVAGAT